MNKEQIFEMNRKANEGYWEEQIKCGKCQWQGERREAYNPENDCFCPNCGAEGEFDDVEVKANIPHFFQGQAVQWRAI